VNFSYQTTRLQIAEILCSSQEPEFLLSVMDVLTPRVVENLPPYFHGVVSTVLAREWLKNITSEGRLFIVNLTGKSNAIGFVFLSNQKSGDTHIGYLLGESYWGKGYATEILKGLIDFIKSEDQITRLIAGVVPDNVASIKLLHKLGFIHSSSEGNGTMFFEYRFSQT